MISRLNLSEVYISSINYVLGKRVAFNQLADPIAQDIRTKLLNEGIEYVRVCNDESWKLATKSALKTLITLHKGTPDAVLYSSEDFKVSTPAKSLSCFLHSLDLLSLPAITMVGHGCGNLGPALRMAASLLSAEGWCKVLVAVADSAESEKRLNMSSLSILSDGAATCLVTKEPIGPSFRLLAVSTAFSQLPNTQEPSFATARLTLKGVRNAVDNVCQKLSWSRSDFTYVIVNNYSRTARKLISLGAGINPTKLLRANVGDIGHCFSADPLINLQQAERQKIFKHGDRLLLISNGANSWSAIVVEHLVLSD